MRIFELRTNKDKLKCDCRFSKNCEIIPKVAIITKLHPSDRRNSFCCKPCYNKYFEKYHDEYYHPEMERKVLR